MPESSEEPEVVKAEAEVEVNEEQKELSSKLEEVTPKGFGLRVVSMPTAEEIKKKQKQSKKRSKSIIRMIQIKQKINHLRRGCRA